MAIKIITDSTSDILLEQARRMEIEVVPLSVHFGVETYLDGVELSPEDFYKKQANAATLPTTSQVSVGDFEQLFTRTLERGDEIVGIFISSKLSGTYQSAVIAKQELGSDKVFLIDSLNVTLGLSLLVYRALALRDEGLGAAEIAEKLEQEKTKIRLLAYIDTLKYLKMGGRLSSTGAVVGTLLSIKPIIEVKDGEVVVVKKERGMARAFEWIVTQTIMDRACKNTRVHVGHANSQTHMQEMIRLLKRSDTKNEYPLFSYAIGTVVGTHAGPGCVGIAYFR